MWKRKPRTVGTMCSSPLSKGHSIHSGKKAKNILHRWLLWQLPSLYFSQIARVAPQVYLSAATALVPSALEGLALTLVSTPWLFVLSICLLYLTYFNCLCAYYNIKVINTTTELPILPLERAVGVRVPLLDSPSGRCSLFERNQCSSYKRIWALCIKEYLTWRPLFTWKLWCWPLNSYVTHVLQSEPSSPRDNYIRLNCVPWEFSNIS